MLPMLRCASHSNKLQFLLRKPSQTTLVKLTRHLSHASSQESIITDLVLKTDGDALVQALELEFNNIPCSPDLADRVLKRLWNHGPKAFAFFEFLDRRSPNGYKHTISTFNHAIDIAGRMRDYATLWNLLSRMRARRVPPTPRTFAIIVERHVSAVLHCKRDRRVLLVRSCWRKASRAMQFPNWTQWNHMLHHS